MTRNAKGRKPAQARKSKPDKTAKKTAKMLRCREDWSLAQRLEFRSSSAKSGCRLWNAGNSKGYGSLWWDGRLGVATRLQWIDKRGPIPKGMCVLHTCDNPACIEITHLFLGTQLENIADCVSKLRHPRGEKKPLAKLTEAAVMEIRTKLGTGQRVRRNSILQSLAIKFGVSESAISMARSGYTWAHVR